MKKLFFIIGLLFITVGLFSQDRQRESYYQAEFAAVVNGEEEVVLPDRTRVDIVTDKYAIEVDFAEKWAEAIGQSLYYADQLDLKPGILLVWEGPDELRYLDRLMAIASKLDITVWVWDWTVDEWSRVDYNLQYLY